jgi:hypothetical protein
VLWSKVYVKPQFVVRMFSLTSYTEWDPFWEVSSRSASQNSPRGNQTFTIAFSELLLVSVLKQMTPATSLYSVSLRLILILSVCLRAKWFHQMFHVQFVIDEKKGKQRVFFFWGSCSCFDGCLNLLWSDTVCYSGCPIFRRNFVLPSSGSIILN